MKKNSFCSRVNCNCVLKILNRVQELRLQVVDAEDAETHNIIRNLLALLFLPDSEIPVQFKAWTKG